MPRLNKQQIRKIVLSKFSNHCAYCGCDIDMSTMQVDHIEPRYRGNTDLQLANRGLSRGDWRIDNLNPACSVCNKWKNAFTIEGFRNEISMQLERVKRDSANYRMCLKYGLIKETPHPIIFFYQTHPAFGVKGLEVVNG